MKHQLTVIEPRNGQLDQEKKREKNFLKEIKTLLIAAFCSHWLFRAEDDPELGAACVKVVCLLDSSFFCCHGNISLPPPYWEAVNITLGFYGVMFPLQQQQLWTTWLGKIEKWDHQFSVFCDSNFFEVKQFLKADVIFLSVLGALEATSMIKNIFFNLFYLLLS